MELTWQAVKAALREVLEDEIGLGKYSIASKWRGGTVILQPEDESLKPREIPMEMFFKKIVGVREKLRVLEQRINNHEHLTDEDKLELQQYITRSYGSLTTFNILFRDEDDRFVGQRDKE